MRKRTLLTVVLIGLMVVMAVLALLVVVLLRGGEKPVTELAEAEKVEVKPVIVDKFAGREADAFAMVQARQVFDPAYVELQVAFDQRAAEELADPKLAEQRKKEREKLRKELLKKQEKGEPLEQEIPPEEDVAPTVAYKTIAELVDAKYLEKEFQMSFLERGNWRALHLDTGEELDDPYYEVYLDYTDGEVTVGPVWVVQIETGVIVARNEMAEFFEFTPQNHARGEEILTRPERVVGAITNHKFEQSGIELGGVLLLHFVNRPEKLRKKEDKIIGWTVAHTFRDEYDAYFQWVEGGKHKVAQFRFDWKQQRLEPRGLHAIDLMVEGEDRKAIPTVSVWPKTYKNDMNVPRSARWDEASACGQKKKEKDVNELCNSFTKVLEQVDFIESVQWLLTKSPEIAAQFESCKERRDCKWSLEKDPESGLYKIRYIYVVGGETGTFGFDVDPEKETIVPADDISEYAFYSVTPRT